MNSKFNLVFANPYSSRTIYHSDEPRMNNRNIRNDDNEHEKQQLGVKKGHLVKK